MANFIKKVIKLITIIYIIYMWSYQNPPQTGSSSPSKLYSEHELQLSKRQYFRLQIRNRQIEQIKRQIRRKYNELKDPNDYQLLRNINLSKCIAECKSYGISANCVHDMFLYASSNSSAHLFELLDDKISNILVQNLLTRVNQNVIEGYQQQLKWNRQIFWILTNYTSYSKIINFSYLQKLREIGRYIFRNTQKNIPFFDEAQQNIVLSLSNLIQKSKNCRCILEQYEQLIYIVINRFIDTEERNSNAINSNLNFVPRIIFYFSQFFHNLYTTIQYEEIEKEKQKKCIKVIIRLLNEMFGQKIMSEEHKKLTLILLDSVTKLLGNSLDNHPELILFHKKQIKKLSQWFQKFIKTQTETSKSDEIIVAYLYFLQVIYGPNIPEKYESYISQFFSKFFENHVGKVCTSMFKNKKPVFQNYTLCLLQPILMEEYLAELIFTEYLPIISYIFYHIQNSSYSLRKQALKCLINLLKSTVYDGSSTADQVLEILLANKISDILAFNLWAYVDAQLNLELLIGVEIIFEAQKNRYETKLNFWRMFTEAGGTLKLNKMLQESKNDVLKDQVNRILDLVKNCDEQI